MALAVGKKAPEFTLAGSNGEDVSLKAHDKFIDKFELPFTLLSDPDHAVAEKYGVWVEKSMYGKKYWGAQRATFVIDAEGKIAHVIEKVTPKTHDDEVLAALAA